MAKKQSDYIAKCPNIRSGFMSVDDLLDTEVEVIDTKQAKSIGSMSLKNLVRKAR